MPGIITIAGKRYRLNIPSSSPRSSGAQAPDIRSILGMPPVTHDSPQPEQQGFLTRPISKGFDKWLQRKTEPEEDDWYATRVGKRVGRVLGEDVNSPLGLGLTAAAAALGPAGWAARAGKLGAGAAKVAASPGLAQAGRYGFGALGASQVPEAARSGKEFLKTKSPESLADTLISGTEVAGGGLLLGSALRKRKKGRAASDIADDILAESGTDIASGPKAPAGTKSGEAPDPDKILRQSEPDTFVERTVEETERGTRPTQSYREFISEDTHKLVDSAQPLRPNVKSSERLVRQTLEIAVERHVQQTGKRPDANAIKRLRSNIIAKAESSAKNSNEKYAALGKIFSEQKAKLASTLKSKDTSLRLPDIKYDIDSINLDSFPTQVRPQVKETLRSAITHGAYLDRDLDKVTARVISKLKGLDRDKIQEVKGAIDKQLIKSRGKTFREAQDFGPVQVLMKNDKIVSAGISPQGRKLIESGAVKGEGRGELFGKPSSLAAQALSLKNNNNEVFINKLAKMKGKNIQDIKNQLNNLHTQMKLVERASYQGQIDGKQSAALANYYSNKWDLFNKKVKASLPARTKRLYENISKKRQRLEDEDAGLKELNNQYEQIDAKLDKKSKKYDPNFTPEMASSLKSKAAEKFQEQLDWDKPISNTILNKFPVEKQLIMALNRLDSIRLKAQKNRVEGELGVDELENRIFQAIKSPDVDEAAMLHDELNNIDEVLRDVDAIELPVWGEADDFNLGKVQDTGNVSASFGNKLFDSAEGKSALESMGIDPNQLNFGIPISNIPGVMKGWMGKIANNDFLSGFVIQGRHTLRKIGGEQLINIVGRQQADEQRLTAAVSRMIDKSLTGMKKKEVNRVFDNIANEKMDGPKEKQVSRIMTLLNGMSDKFNVASSHRARYDPTLNRDRNTGGTPRENFIDWAILRIQGITRAKHFTNGGTKDIKGSTSDIAKAIAQTNDQEKARAIVESTFKTRPNNWGQAKIVDTLNSIQFGSHLSLHVIGNLSGNTNILLHGRKNMKASIESLFNRKQAKAQAERSGALGDSSTALFSSISAGKWSKAISKGIGLSYAESRERTTAATFGKITVQSLWDMKKADKLSKKGKLELEDLILEDPDRITKLSPTHMRYAKQRFSEITQGGSNPLNVPPGWSGSNAINLFFIFKKFAYQGNIAIFKAIQKNPKKTLPMIAILGQLMGEGVGDLRATAIGTARGATESIKEGENPLDTIPKAVGKEIDYRTDRAKFITGSDNPVINRMVSNYADAWITGLFTDTLLSIAQGDAEELGGANIDFFTSIADTGRGAVKGAFSEEGIIEGIGEGNLRDWTRRVPFVGSGVAKGMWPSRSQRYGSEGRQVTERVVR